MYPKLPMKFRLSTRSAPFLSIGPGGFSLQPVVDVQAYAVLPDATLAPLFLLSLVSWAQPAALQLLGSFPLLSSAETAAGDVYPPPAALSDAEPLLRALPQEGLLTVQNQPCRGVSPTGKHPS